MSHGFTTKGKAAGSYAAASHTHSISDVTGLQTALDGKQASLGFTAENTANKGQANGYASLDSSGNVPIGQISLPTAEAFVTATTTLSAATYADITGASITLAAGTWLILANVYGYATNAAFQLNAAITDSANNIVTEGTSGAQAGGTNINQWTNVALTAIVTPGSETTYKLRGARGNTTLTANVIVADGSGQGVTNNASSNRDKSTGIRAIRIS